MSFKNKWPINREMYGKSSNDLWIRGCVCVDYRSHTMYWCVKCFLRWELDIQWKFKPMVTKTEIEFRSVEYAKGERKGRGEREGEGERERERERERVWWQVGQQFIQYLYVWSLGSDIVFTSHYFERQFLWNNCRNSGKTIDRRGKAKVDRKIMWQIVSYRLRHTFWGALITPVLYPNWNIPSTAENIANTNMHVKPCN